MAEQSVTLQPGESKAVSFEATPREARTYQVSIEGLTGSFVAKALPTASADMAAFDYDNPQTTLAGVKIEIVGISGCECITKHDYGGKWAHYGPGCIIRNIPPGTHTIRLSLSGYRPISFSRTFKPGETYANFYYLHKED